MPLYLRRVLTLLLIFGFIYIVANWSSVNRWLSELSVPSVDITNVWAGWEETTAVVNPECQISQTLDPNRCTIRIGIINSFTRNNTCFAGGTEHRRGYELALETINQQGGINGCQVELVQIDDRDNPQAAINAVNTLALQDIPLLIGAYTSDATLLAAREADRQSIPLIIPSASTELITALGYEWVFRINADSSDYIAQALRMTSELNEQPTIGIIFENSVFGESAAVAVTAQAEENGISIVAYEPFLPGTADLTAPLQNIRAADPDAVYLVSNSITDAINLLTTSQSINLRPDLMIGGAGAFVSPDFLERVGDKGEGLIVTAQWSEDVPWADPDGLDALTFGERFRQRYNNSTPGMRSVQTYTSLMLAKMVLERTKDDPTCHVNMRELRACLRQALSDIELENSIFGPINFDVNGQNEHPVLMLQIVPDGAGGYRFATIYPSEFSTQQMVLPTPEE
jgi:branched-chain amino acid transport system substrate-binding protein